MLNLDPGAVDHGLPARELLVEERFGFGRAFADRLDAKRLHTLAQLGVVADGVDQCASMAGTSVAADFWNVTQKNSADAKVVSGVGFAEEWPA
jgi:hypothetical protein